MRKFIGLTFIVGLLILASCSRHNDNNQSSLTLSINPMFGSNAMSLNHTYEAPDHKYYNFSNFKFYLSHIKLVHSDASTVEVCPIAYFSADDSRTWNISLTNTAGSYVGIQFNIGLDSTQNSMPVSIDSTNPLYANNFTTWGSKSLQYVFVQLDGYADTVSNPSNIITYHVGTNVNYTSAPVLAKNFSVNSSTQTLTLNADLQKVFYNAADTGVINIFVNPITQTTDHPALAHTFITEFPQIFSLQ
jgi:hypothetical protein